MRKLKMLALGAVSIGLRVPMIKMDGCLDTIRQAIVRAAALLLLSPIAVAASSFSFQSPVGSACLPVINSSTPINGAGSCDIPFFPGSLNGTETRDLQWRADYSGLGLSYDYLLSGDAVVGPWGASGQTGFATVGAFDVLTITGGSGAGILRVVTDVHGSTSVLPGSLFAPFAQTQISTNLGPTTFYGTGTFALDIPFTYGLSFDLSRLFFVGVGPIGIGSATSGPWGPYGASADFLHSADFTFGVLDTGLNPVSGTTITSDSGFVYSQGPPVPEPTSLTLLGLGLLGVVARRRAKR